MASFAEPPLRLENTSASERYAASWSSQLHTLVHREWRVTRPGLFSSNLLLLHGGNAVLCGILFARIGYEEQDIFPRFTACFIALIGWMFFPLFSALMIIPPKETYMRKELSVGAYRLSAWFVAVNFVKTIPELVYPPVNLTIFWWASGVCDDALAFFAMWGLIVLEIIFFQSLGMAISVVTPPARSVSITMLFVTFFFTYTGLLIPIGDSFTPWLVYANPVYYTISLGSHIVWRPYDTHACDINGTLGALCDDIGDDHVTRDDILENLQLNFPPWGSVLFLVLGALLLRLLAFFMLRRKLTTVMFTQQTVKQSSEASKEKGVALTKSSTASSDWAQAADASADADVEHNT